MAFNVTLLAPSQIKPGDRLILGVNDSLSEWEPPRTVKVEKVCDEAGGWVKILVESPTNTPCNDHFDFPARRLVLVAVYFHAID
jgi:hypothetical protein